MKYFKSHIGQTILKITLSFYFLLLGAVIYFIRPSEVLFTKWLKARGLKLQLWSFDLEMYFRDKNIPDWVLYSMPDGLWAFAYALLITSLWAGGKDKSKKLWLLSIPLLTVGFEGLQAIHILFGTFCITDLGFTVAGIALGYLIGKKRFKTISDENNKTQHSKRSRPGHFSLGRHGLRAILRHSRGTEQ